MERLTEAQLGIWLGHQRAADPCVYNAAECVLLRGAFDVGSFTRALDDTLREAVALHVAFPEVNGEPYLTAREYTGPRYEFVDLSHEAEPEKALFEAAARELERPFAIEVGELFLHRVYKLSDECHAWLHVAHHIALDGYAFNLIQRRVAERYSARVQGKDCAPGAFTDLSPVRAEDAAYGSSQDRSEDRAFWLAELAETRGARLAPWAPKGPSRARRVRRAFWPGESAALKSFATELGVDWSDVLLAVIAGWVHASTGLSTFNLGLPVMLRLGSRALKTPCMAMNIVALPVACSKQSTLVTLSRAVHEARKRQKRRHRYRYEHLKAELDGVPFGPIVNIMPFDVPLRFGACAAEIVGISAGPVEDLAFGVVPRNGGLELTLDAHPEAFTQSELEELSERLIAVAATWLSNPDLSVATVVLERCAKPLDTRTWPPALIHGWALERADAAALVEGERVVSYRELDAAARGFAEQVLGLTPGEGSIVTIQGPRSIATVVAILGVLYAGLGYTVLEATHPRERRQRVLDQMQPRLVVETGETPWDLELPPSVTRVRLDETRIAESVTRAAGPPRMPALGAPAYVVFTSGSTGEPKGVVVSTAALAAFVAAARSVYGVEPGERVLQFAPFTFDASVEELFVTLSAGAALVLRDDAMLDSPRSFAESCERRGINVLDLPTAYFHELGYGLEELGACLPSCVRLVIIGGEAAHAERIQRFVRRNPGVRLLNTYGPSEGTVVATVAELSAWDGVGEVPIGRALPGVDVALVDEHGVLVEDVGAPGELCLLGPQLASGYLGREDLTRERFVSLPGLGRAYRTGDRARWNQHGELVYLGRVDDELKISGYRIAPAEVEAALARHPAVRSSVVRAESSRDGAKRLTAYVEGDTAVLDARSLRSFLRELVPAPMIPSEFTILEVLPRTAHGKLDRNSLSPGREAPSEREPTRGGDALESAVLGVWHEVLGAHPVSLDDDFFVLGGNSLQVIQVASRLSRLGREVTVASVFKHPTPRKLAGLLRSSLGEPRAEAREFRPLDVELPARWFTALRAEAPRSPKRVLLTGASGFVGIHLLEAWLELSSAEIVCVVRGASEAAARARLEEVARQYGVDLARARDRYQVVARDLAARATTLDELAQTIEPCDQLVHAAAQVSVTRDYASLVPANVLATRELLGLSARWSSPFHYISSISTLPLEGEGSGGAGVAVEERFYPRHAGLREGYPQSKWHAERLCEAAGALGLPVGVYRLGRVTGATTRPSVNPQDLVWTIVRAAKRLGYWPDLPIEEPWIPVDTAAQTLVRLVLAGSATAPATPYHLVQTGVVHLDRVRDALARLGNSLGVLPVPAWIERLRASGDDDDRALLAFFELSGGAPSTPGSDEPTVRIAPREMSWSRLQSRLPDVQTGAVSDALLSAYCERALG